MLNTTPLWYAVYTKPKWEKKVAELLRRKNIEAYCPLNNVVKQWHDRKKTVEEPLFTSYVFVCITSAEKVEVCKTTGILNFVHWLGKPAVIRAQEIETIKEFLLQYGTVSLEKTDVWQADIVQIQHGPLMNREGVVLEVYPKTIKLAIPSLGYNLIAQVEKANVEVVRKATLSTEASQPHFAALKLA
jgi:transcription antitermination factor NusG